MKTQYEKAEKLKQQSHKRNFSFSVLTSKRKTHFRDSGQVYHGINWLTYRTPKSESVLRLPTLSLFVYLIWLIDVCLSARAKREHLYMTSTRLSAKID